MTRCCLAAIDAYTARRPGSALDMGCGSGILALAMAHKWRCPVTAVDADPKAVRTTRRNAGINRLGGALRVAQARGYRGLGGPYDFIVSNILARPLIAMAGGLAGSLAPGGTAVLSGFHGSDINRVAAAHAARGLIRQRFIEDDGWAALVMKKGGS